MRRITVLYNDDVNGNGFTYTREYESEFIPDSINVLIDVLRLEGFSDSLIEKWLGYSHFEMDDCYATDDDYDCCGQCD